MKKVKLFTTSIAIFLSLIAASSVKAATFKDNQVVSSNKTWTIKFTQEVTLDEPSKSGITIKDSKGNTVPVTLQLGSNPKTILVLPPNDGYKAGENYILTLNNNIKNTKGKKLKTNTDVHFSIENNLQKETSLGNTAGNSVNKTLVAETDNYIYFLNSKYWDVSDIYRMDKSEKNITKINKNDLGEIGNLSLMNNTIYFEKYSERNPDYNYKTNNTVKEYITNLYTLSSDGTISTKILSNIDQYITTNKNIYYINTGDNNTLYKSDLDGNNKVKLIDTPISYFNISEQNIIYSTKEQTVKKSISETSAGKIYKTDLAGSNSVLLTDNIGYCLNTVNNYVYYINYSDTNKIYKISLDGKENTKVYDDSTEAINVNDGWIYYCNNSKPVTINVGYGLEQTAKLGTLYKIKTDGTGSQKLNNSYSMNLSVLTDNVYYLKYFDNGGMSWGARTKISKDGSNDIDVSDFVSGTTNNNSSTNNSTDNTNSSTTNTNSMLKLTSNCVTVTRDSNNNINKIVLNIDNLPSSVKQSVVGVQLIFMDTLDESDAPDMLNSVPSDKLSSDSGLCEIFSSEGGEVLLHMAIGLVDLNGKTVAYYAN